MPDVERRLHVADLKRGLAVRYGGHTQEVFSERPERSFLLHGHPGRVWFPDFQHVMVDWLDLEDSVESFAVGYTSGRDGYFTSLRIIDESDWDTTVSRYRRALAELKKERR